MRDRWKNVGRLWIIKVMNQVMNKVKPTLKKTNQLKKNMFRLRDKQSSERNVGKDDTMSTLWMVLHSVLAGGALGAIGGKMWGDYEDDGDTGLWIGVAVGVVTSLIWSLMIARTKYSFLVVWILCLIGIGFAFFTHYHIDSESVPGFFMILAYGAIPFIYTTGYKDGMAQR
jgi:FtsH-binding integral membrane protein